MKYRKALLDDEVTAIIREKAAKIEDRFPIDIEAIGTDRSHIHLLCSAQPKMAPGGIVQVFKRITAREIFRRKPAVKRVLWGWGIEDRWVGTCVETVTVFTTARPTPGRSPATQNVLVL